MHSEFHDVDKVATRRYVLGGISGPVEAVSMIHADHVITSPCSLVKTFCHRGMTGKGWTWAELPDSWPICLNVTVPRAKRSTILGVPFVPSHRAHPAGAIILSTRFARSISTSPRSALGDQATTVPAGTPYGVGAGTVGRSTRRVRQFGKSAKVCKSDCASTRTGPGAILTDPSRAPVSKFAMSSHLATIRLCSVTHVKQARSADARYAVRTSVMATVSKVLRRPYYHCG